MQTFFKTTATPALVFHIGDRIVVTGEMRYQQGLVGIIVDIKGAMTDRPIFKVSFDEFEMMAALSDTCYDSDDEEAARMVSLHGTIRPFHPSELAHA